MKKSYIRIEGRIILKIKVLEYFITLAESQSINEAAGKLYIAQPSLTKALQLFEAEIGTQLFQRKKTGIQLTEAGKRILPEAKQMVEYYNGWLSLSEKLPLRAVDIYIQASFPNFLLPKVVLQFKKLHPSLQINCEVSRTPEQYISQDTERPVLSLFVCGQKGLMEKCVKAQGTPPIVLFQGEYCCLVNKHSSLAEKETVVPQDLKEHYLALKSRLEAPSTAMQPVLDEIVPVISPSQVIQTDSVDSVINLVRTQSDVYALSYYPILKRYPGVSEGEIVSLPFKGDYTKGDFCLFYSRKAYRQYPVLQELVTAIQDAAAQFLAEN